MLDALNKTNGWRLALYTLLGTWVIGSTANGLAEIVKAVRGAHTGPAVNNLPGGSVVRAVLNK